MKIDKKMLDAVLKLNDDQLWKAIVLVASKSGFDIKQSKQPKDMSKLRATLSNLTDEDISRVSELLKKGNKNG